MIKSIFAAVLVVGFAGTALAQTPAPKTEAPKTTATAPKTTTPKAAAPKADPAKQAQAAIDKADKELKQVREQIQKDRKAIVAELMHLSDADAAIFWPLYSEYRAAMKKDVGDRGSDMVTDYALNQDAMTDEQAIKLMNEWFAVQKAELDVKSVWYAKFREKLPVRTATRFFQIDNRLDMIVQFQVAAELPVLK